MNALLEAYFFYDIKRFDIKGKEFLRTLGKYYIVDIGLRNYLLGFRDRDSGHAIENVVYFELLRRDYDVSIGKVDNSEVDFIATKVDDKLYVQVTESMYINTPVPVARKKLIKHPLYRLIHDEPNPEMLTSNPQPKPYRNFPAIHFFSNQTKK